MKKKKDEIIDTLSVISNKWATPSNYFTVSFEFSKYRDLYYAKYYGKGGGGGEWPLGGEMKIISISNC